MPGNPARARGGGAESENLSEKLKYYRTIKTEIKTEICGLEEWRYRSWVDCPGSGVICQVILLGPGAEALKYGELIRIIKYHRTIKTEIG